MSSKRVGEEEWGKRERKRRIKIPPQSKEFIFFVLFFRKTTKKNTKTTTRGKIDSTCQKKKMYAKTT